jgi:hypothetical protein
MTLRFSERYVMALNLLLIAVLAYFLALSVNDIILGRVAGGARALVPSLIGAEPSAPVVHFQSGASGGSSRRGRDQHAYQAARHLVAHAFAAIHHRRRR